MVGKGSFSDGSIWNKTYRIKEKSMNISLSEDQKKKELKTGVETSREIM